MLDLVGWSRLRVNLWLNHPHVTKNNNKDVTVNMKLIGFSPERFELRGWGKPEGKTRGAFSTKLRSTIPPEYLILLIVFFPWGHVNSARSSLNKTITHRLIQLDKSRSVVDRIYTCLPVDSSVKTSATMIINWYFFGSMNVSMFTSINKLDMLQLGLINLTCKHCTVIGSCLWFQRDLTVGRRDLAY